MNSGVRVVLGTREGQILAFDITTRSVLAEVAGHKGEVMAVYACDNKGLVISVGRADRKIRLWDQDNFVCQQCVSADLPTKSRRTVSGSGADIKVCAYLSSQYARDSRNPHIEKRF